MSTAPTSPPQPPLHLLQRLQPAPPQRTTVAPTRPEALDTVSAYHAARRWRARAIGTLLRRGWRLGLRSLHKRCIASWRWLTWGFRWEEEDDPFRPA